ncbi:MAG: 2-C-methyl-D-erythritol 4-phosphate cytidylyltransferase [Candidatus Omnitrophica bacterium]|nr:2-C-methyl-D-erythritol 4-phosphate cytidylyltransferase [Candidatus Omnitrophota bacterium]
MRKVRTVAIVPSAGRGTRLGAGARKPFVRLAGKPLVAYALKALQSCGSVDAIIVAAEPSCVGRIERLARRNRFTKVIAVVAGGKERSGSVRNCLKRVPPGCEVVLIHDAARPFLKRRMIEDAVLAARRFGACVAAVPETDTVKLAGRKMSVKRTLDRNSIFRAQTPQAFRWAIIKAAYGAGGKPRLTDDAAMVERAGGAVRIIPGSYRNIKITTREDLKIAEAFL